MWNSKSLQPPPYCELKVEITHQNRVLLRKACEMANKTASIYQDHCRLLKMEEYILKRAVYKLNNQFRSEKSLRGVRMMLTYLKKLDGSSITAKIQETLQFCLDEDSVYLPSRQTVEYHLVRLQGLAAVLAQIVSYGFHTFPLLKAPMDLGMMITQNVVLMAGTARVWSVCRSLCEHVCSWYHHLHACLTIVQPTSVEWLKGELPGSLKGWIEETFDDWNKSHHNSDMERGLELEVRGSDLSTDGGAGQPLLAGSGLAPHSEGTLDGADPLNNLAQDIGEPIRRKRPLPEPTNNTTGQQSASKKQKKKQGQASNLLTNKEREDGNEVSDANDECQNSTIQNVSLNGTSASLLSDKVRLPEMKKMLKSLLVSIDDVEHFKRQVENNTVNIGNDDILLSEVGRKKIVKQVATVMGTFPESGCYSIKDEESSLKVLRGRIGKVLLKHGEHRTALQDSLVSSVNSHNRGKSVRALPKKTDGRLNTGNEQIWSKPTSTAHLNAVIDTKGFDIERFSVNKQNKTVKNKSSKQIKKAKLKNKESRKKNKKEKKGRKKRLSN